MSVITRHSPSHRAARRAGAILALAALAAAGLLGDAPAPPSPGLPQPVRARLAASATHLASMRSAAAGVAGRLGLPGIAGSPSDTTDAAGVSTTTVEFHAADGPLASVVILDAGGRALEIVDLTNAPALDVANVDGSGARGVARHLVAVAGLTAPAAEPLTTWDAGMDAWCVRWVRLIGDVPAPADGLTAWVHRGGQLKAISQQQSPLAATPQATIAAADAMAAARAFAARWHLDGMPSLVYAAPRMAWVAPDSFVDSTSTSPSATLRLAWVIALSYVPPGWHDRHVVELDVDAGTGAIIGGTETA